MMSRLILVFLICTVQIIHSELTDTEEGPVDLSQLKHVKIANFEGIFDEHMSKLFQNAETLRVSNCTLKPINQNFLIPLKNLRKLSIDNSNIVREKHDIKNCCLKMRELELIGNGFAEIDWRDMDSWQLEKIYFFREKVPALPANMLSGSKMKEFTIEYSEVETIDEDAFSKFKDLEVLNLQRNKIQKITKKMLEPLQNVREINLKNNLLEKLSTGQFPSMPNLEKINVGHNPIKEINLEGLKTLAPKLKEVDISGIEVDTTKSGDGIPFVKMSIL